MTITPKLIRTDVADYEPAQWGGRNMSGIEPLRRGDGMILVLPDKAMEKSKGGVIIIDEQQKREALAAESGILVAEDVSPSLAEHVGKRVYFGRYAGVTVTGKDGQSYRLMTVENLSGLESE